MHCAAAIPSISRPQAAHAHPTTPLTLHAATYTQHYARTQALTNHEHERMPYSCTKVTRPVAANAHGCSSILRRPAHGEAAKQACQQIRLWLLLLLRRHNAQPQSQLALLHAGRATGTVLVSIRCRKRLQPLAAHAWPLAGWPACGQRPPGQLAGVASRRLLQRSRLTICGVHGLDGCWGHKRAAAVGRHASDGGDLTPAAGSSSSVRSGTRRGRGCRCQHRHHSAPGQMSLLLLLAAMDVKMWCVWRAAWKTWG